MQTFKTQGSYQLLSIYYVPDTVLDISTSISISVFVTLSVMKDQLVFFDPLQNKTSVKQNKNQLLQK